MGAAREDCVGRGLIERIEPDPAAVATEPGERPHRFPAEPWVTGERDIHDADGPALLAAIAIAGSASPGSVTAANSNVMVFAPSGRSKSS